MADDRHSRQVDVVGFYGSLSLSLFLILAHFTAFVVGLTRIVESSRGASRDEEAVGQ